MSTMDGPYPSGAIRRIMIDNYTTLPMLSPDCQQHWSTRQDGDSTYLPQSKNDLDMSRLPRPPSSSRSSCNRPSVRSDIFPWGREGKPQSGVKQLLSRSSRLLQKRRSTNKLTSMDSGHENDDGFSLGLDSTGRGRASSDKLSSEKSVPQRPYISVPYNFQHLTHTGPLQAKALQCAKQNQLMSEFCAIRASQAAKPELKGIKADNILPQRELDTYSPATSRSGTPSLSPNAMGESGMLRPVKSIDSFTRRKHLTSNSFSSPHPPVSPPPRRSSRQANRTSVGLGLKHVDTTLAPEVSSPNSTNSPTSFFLPQLEDSSQEIAQAVTTPDDSAQLFITHQRNVSSTILADVPEEEEEGAKADRRQSQSKDLRHARSFPARASFQAPTPNFGDDEIPARWSRHISSNFVQTSWEDDIDYCYEHAMEAAGLDWGAETWAEEDATPEAEQRETSPYPLDSSLHGTNSATSSAVSVPGIMTPPTPAPVRDSFSTSHSLLFPQSPAILESKDYSMPEDHFQTRVTSVEFIKEPVSYPATVATESSPRSSGTGLTKWSSHESLSTQATSVITSSSKHRHSTSIGSIPDLIPYDMPKRNTAIEAEVTSFHRSHSSENMMMMLPPPPPITGRSRANSESASKLLDLAMIGAPAPLSSRARAGSMASAKARQSAGPPARVSYNLFPTSNMVTSPRQ